MGLLNLLAIFQLLTAPSWRSCSRRLACSGHRKPARGRWERRVWRGWLGAADMMMMVVVVVVIVVVIAAAAAAAAVVVVVVGGVGVVVVAVLSTGVNQRGELQPWPPFNTFARRRAPLENYILR